MRENDYKNRQEVESITNELWKSINILRGALPVEHYHVYLFLLSGYYDGTIKSSYFNSVTNYNDSICLAFNSESKYSELFNMR